MAGMRPVLIFCTFVSAASCLMAQTATPSTPMPKDPAAILQLAQEENNIDMDGLKPWHLKATFQVFDEKGKPTETATLDEIWVGVKRQKRTWSSPSFNQVEIVNESGRFRSGDKNEVPMLLEEARRTMVHPMPTVGEIAGTQLDLQKKRFGKVDLNCVMLSQPIKGVTHAPLGLFPTYCFDIDRPTYRVGFEYGDTTYVTNQIGTFLGRSVAVKDGVSVKSVKRVEGTVDFLGSIPEPEDQTFAAPPEAMDISSKAVAISPGVAAGYRLNGADPIYPQAAKEAHIQGTVIMRAIIGRDGRIHALRVQSANDADLAISAIIAVRGWTYKPYLLNGVPTEVDTMITVNFTNR